MRLRIILALLSLSLIATACDDITEPGDTPPLPGAATVRVVNAAPGAASVDVLLDELPLASGVAFASTSGCLVIGPGTKTLVVRLAGSATDLDSLEPRFERDTSYTVLITGGAGSVATAVLADAPDAPAAGHTGLRAINAASTAGALDVHLDPPGMPLGSALIASLAPGASSPFVDVPAGDAHVRFTGAGTTALVADAGTLSLPSAGATTVIAVPSASGGAPVGVLSVDACA